jgi:putative peptide-modifying radical SAM enzyme
MEDWDGDFEDFDIDYSLPRKISYNVENLAKFCRQDQKCVLTFYGGEPLLCTDEMEQIMDKVKANLFMIQTNGLLLDRLPPEYVNRLHTILVSIDGDEHLTDFYRGKGVFRKVVNNLRLIRQNGFKGELIARMTVMEQTDINRQVKWLLCNDAFSFSSVHWQLNAGFWKNDFSRRDFKQWSEKSYNAGIRKLAQFWVDEMEKNTSVLRLYPILGIAQSLISGEKMNLLRCGGGWTNYAIQTDGYIVPCPTMWGMRDYYLGHISNADPLSLRKVFVGKPCTDCPVRGLCGGRCLYATVTNRWNKEAYGLVCDTVKNLIQAVFEQLPRLKKLIDEGRIVMKDFEYVRYNGCEIIP